MSFPFVISPQKIELVRLGSSVTGEICLIKKGFISVAEQQALDNIDYLESKTHLKATQLVKLIADQEGIDTKLAADFIQQAIYKKDVQFSDTEIMTKYMEISEKYEAEINELWKSQVESTPERILYKVLVYLRYRLIRSEELIAIQELLDLSDWEGLRKYCDRRSILTDQEISLNFVKGLSADLIEEIKLFFANEREKKLEPKGNTTLMNESPS